MSFVEIISIFLLFCFLWWWFVTRNSPKFPPLEIDDNDPLMLEAVKKAQSSILEFQKLFNEKEGEFQVKIPFETSSGEIENLWAEVKEWNGSTLSVLYLTPPVTHSGKVERKNALEVSEIIDWVYFSESEEIFGGYSQRVMFQRAEEKWGVLPKELEEQKSRYVA